jgi:muramoyltetrapeptide carboxypeptidase LdcA involved in peptidoglycan recycling
MLSGGRAGDPDMIERYLVGKHRLESIFGLKVIETPNALKGSEFLYRNPKARADDLMQALLDPNIKAIITNMGGDDTYRLWTQNSNDNFTYWCNGRNRL